MTIRVLMLEDRASGASTTYAKGSQYDLPEATAALYIHNRWATYVSGDLVPNDAVPVSAQIDPVTGGIRTLPAANSLDVLMDIGPKARTGMWQGCMYQAWQTAFGGYVWRLVLELPCHATAFRVAVPKMQQGTWTVDGIAVCSTNTAASPARLDPGGGSAWVTGTFDGSTAAKTIPQFTPPDQYQTNALGDVVWSDWIFCPTVDRTDVVGESPLVVISIYSASANTGCMNGGTGSENAFGSEPLARWCAFKSGANATISFSTGTSNPQSYPIFAVEFAPKVSALSLGAFGDSIMRGEKTSPLSRGYVIKAAATMQAGSSYAVSSVNSGNGGDKVINSYNRFRLLCQSGGGLPNIAMFAPYSRNSVATMSAGQMQGVAEAFIKTAKKYGVLPALVTAIPETATPANNTTADAMNVITRNLATAYNIPLIQNDLIITSANAATMLDVDGIHPNNTGDDALGVNAGNALIPWIPRAFQIGI